MKKSLALLLALLMLSSQFAACSESTENADTDASTTAPDAADATAATEETVDPNARVDDGLEDGVTYDGFTFNIFSGFC